MDFSWQKFFTFRNPQTFLETIVLKKLHLFLENTGYPTFYDIIQFTISQIIISQDKQIQLVNFTLLGSMTDWFQRIYF